MGWFGASEDLHATLVRVEADQIENWGEDGPAYAVRGTIAVGLGGDEVVLSDDAEYRKDGVWLSLTELMNGGEKG